MQGVQQGMSTTAWFLVCLTIVGAGCQAGGISVTVVQIRRIRQRAGQEVRTVRDALDQIRHSLKRGKDVTVQAKTAFVGVAAISATATISAPEGPEWDDDLTGPENFAELRRWLNTRLSNVNDSVRATRESANQGTSDLENRITCGIADLEQRLTESSTADLDLTRWGVLLLLAGTTLLAMAGVWGAVHTG